MKIKTSRTELRNQRGKIKTAAHNLREKTKQESKEFQKAVEKLRKQKGLKPHPKYGKPDSILYGRTKGDGSSVINPQRKAEKLRMEALGLKNRKQLRKYRKKENKLNHEKAPSL